jgi:hypothetical protein
VTVIAPPPPEPGASAPAEAVGDGDVARGRKLENGGAEIALGTLVFQPSLANVAFVGEGTPIGGTQRESFRHHGREIGLDAPAMWGAELSAHYLRRYVAAGVVAFVAGHPGGADALGGPTDRRAAEQVSASGVVGYGGGIDLAAALPLGPVAFRAGGVVGLRGFSVPMTGFEKKTCHSKGRRYPCDETATTGALLFLEPRVRMEISPGKSGFVVGGYAGMGIIGGVAPTMGVFIGLATPHETLQP